jgi:hypothetical protein
MINIEIKIPVRNVLRHLEGPEVLKNINILQILYTLHRLKFHRLKTVQTHQYKRCLSPRLSAYRPVQEECVGSVIPCSRVDSTLSEMEYNGN